MKLDDAKKIIDSSESIAFFTGAGLSQASGIPTFRGENGLWDDFGENFSTWKDMFSSIYQQPNEFKKFFINFVEPIIHSKPNAGHDMIAKMQNIKPTSVVTQNVDDLHMLAGSKAVVELHGNIYEQIDLSGNVQKIDKEVFTEIISKLRSMSDNELSSSVLINLLLPILEIEPQRIRKPNLIMFGDQLSPEKWESAKYICKQCDCLIVVGTSRTVFPATSLIEIAKDNEADIISINPDIADDKHNICMKADKALEKIISLIEKGH